MARSNLFSRLQGAGADAGAGPGTSTGVMEPPPDFEYGGDSTETDYESMAGPPPASDEVLPDADDDAWKQQAGYTDPESRCYNCTNFNGADTCSAYNAQVDPMGGCRESFVSMGDLEEDVLETADAESPQEGGDGLPPIGNREVVLEGEEEEEEEWL